VTSCLAEDEVVPLAPGERRSWPWGGVGPVELSLAVRGEATVRLGEHGARMPGGGWQHVVLLAPDGAATIDVTAGARPVEVADLVAVARDEQWVEEAMALSVPRTGLRRLARRLLGRA
jgi:hypothetical protein